MPPISIRTPCALLLISSTCGTPSPRSTPSADAPHDSPRTRKPADVSATEWWRDEPPRCAPGELRQRHFRWGNVYWCSIPGLKPDGNLQNDLGRLAHCVHDAVRIFQIDPEHEQLGDFLEKAHKSIDEPYLCEAIPSDRNIQTYHGRPIRFARRILPSQDPKTIDAPITIQYRFSCDDCWVAAETTINAPKPPSSK